MYVLAFAFGPLYLSLIEECFFLWIQASSIRPLSGTFLRALKNAAAGVKAFGGLEEGRKNFQIVFPTIEEIQGKSRGNKVWKGFYTDQLTNLTDLLLFRVPARFFQMNLPCGLPL